MFFFALSNWLPYRVVYKLRSFHSPEFEPIHGL